MYTTYSMFNELANMVSRQAYTANTDCGSVKTINYNSCTEMTITLIAAVLAPVTQAPLNS